jgi:hypothetical protein
LLEQGHVSPRFASLRAVLRAEAHLGGDRFHDLGADRPDDSFGD